MENSIMEDDIRAIISNLDFGFDPNEDKQIVTKNTLQFIFAQVFATLEMSGKLLADEQDFLIKQFESANNFPARPSAPKTKQALWKALNIFLKKTLTSDYFVKVLQKVEKAKESLARGYQSASSITFFKTNSKAFTSHRGLRGLLTQMRGFPLLFTKVTIKI